MSVSAPVTLLPAEKDPILTVRCAYLAHSCASAVILTRPVGERGMRTTSATLSRHISSLLRGDATSHVHYEYYKMPLRTAGVTSHVP